MFGGQKKVLLGVCFLAGCQSASLAAAQGEPFRNAHVQHWAEQLHKGELQSLQKETASFPVSDPSSMFAKAIHADIRVSLLPPGANPEPSQDISFEIARLYKTKRFRKLLTQYQPEQVEALSNPFALNMLAVAAIREERYDIGLRYARILRKQYPNLFLSTMAFDSLADDESVRLEILRELKTEVSPKGPLNDYLLAVLSVRPLDPLNRVMAIQKWLQVYPSDVHALLALSLGLNELGRLEEALKAARQAFVIFPFPILSHETEANLSYPYLLEVTGDHARARLVIHQMAQAVTTVPDSVELFARDWYADILTRSGNLGQAQSVLKEASALWPHDARIEADWAEFLFRSHRYAESVSYAVRAAALSPGNIDNQERVLVSQTWANKRGDALNTFRDLTARYVQTTPNMYLYGISLASTADRNNFPNILEEARERFPNSRSILFQSALAWDALGQTDKAIAAFESALAMQAPTNFDEVTAIRVAVQKKSVADANRMLSAVRARFPGSDIAWEQPRNADFNEDYLSRRLDTWEKVLKVAPGQVWPYEAAAADLSKFKKFDAAREWLKKGEKAISKDDTGGQAALLLGRAKVEIASEAMNGADNEKREATLEMLDRYVAMGGSRGVAHPLQSRLLLNAHRNDEAAAMILKALAVDPDDSDLIWELATTCSHPQRWAAAKAYLDRNPWEPKRYRLLIQLHVMYGGSPLVALSLTERLRSLDPSRVNSAHEGHAWDALGDYRKSFDLQYANTRGLANSVRYIDWYEGAIEKAQMESSVVTPFPSALSASILEPNGLQFVRRDHPVSGKEIYYKRGAYWHAVTYDADGQYPLFATGSAGYSLFSYDPTGRLTRIQTQEKEAYFEYGAGPVPVKITVAGVGDATLDARGRPVAYNCVPQGKNCQSLLVRYLLLQGGGAPILPDVRMDSLHAAAASELGPTPFQNDATYPATMALLDNLLTRASADPSFAREALQFATALFLSAEQNGKNPFAVVEAWGKAAEIIYGRRLPLKEWELWNRMLDTLEELKVEFPAADSKPERKLSVLFVSGASEAAPIPVWSYQARRDVKGVNLVNGELLMSNPATDSVAMPGGATSQTVLNAKDGIWWLTSDKATRISDVPAKALVALQDEIVFLQKGKVFRLKERNGIPFIMGHRAPLPKGMKIQSLAPFPLQNGDVQLLLITNQGAYRVSDNELLPLAIPGLNIKHLSGTSAGASWFAAWDKKGIAFVDLTNQYVDSRGRVNAIVAAPAGRYIYVARLDGVEVVDTLKAKRPAKLMTMVKPALARASNGVIANDGLDVLLWTDPKLPPQKLFATREPVQQLFQSSDGAVWAIAGASVCRWKNSILAEFSISKTPALFPARSDLPARIVETHDNKVWVIASNEDFRDAKGMLLEGGILEWTGDRFVRHDEITRGNNLWFVTAYTVLGDGIGMAGTTKGFALHNANGFMPINADARAYSPSYQALGKKNPSLWLGTQGAKAKDGTWVFGSAGGLVTYRDGTWDLAEAMNSKLPGARLFGGKYGSQTITAVESDAQGNLYVGTPRGLLISPLN